MQQQTGQRRPTDPTPQEIAERAAEIRAGWSDDERRKRAMGNTEEVREESGLTDTGDD